MSENDQTKKKTLQNTKLTFTPFTPKNFTPSFTPFVPQSQSNLPLSTNTNTKTKPKKTTGFGGSKETKTFPTQTLHSFFVDDNLKQNLVNRTYEILKTLSPEEPLTKIIPKKVKEFHSLYPLDDISELEKESKIFNVSTGTYRATSSSSGVTCSLKRIISKNLDIDEAENVISIFSEKIPKHPNIVQLKKCMPIYEFETNDLCVVYEFIPGCVTLEYKYFVETRRTPAETLLWSYICQILLALKEIHNSGLAYRCLHLSKILLRGKQRIYLNSIGIMDFMKPSEKSLKELQFQDLKDFGYLISSLVLKSKNIQNDEETLLNDLNSNSSNFSKELIEFLKFLIKMKIEDDVTIETVVQKIIFQFLNEIKYLEEEYDFIENEMVKELQNGRLFRLLTKLSFINQPNLNENEPTNQDLEIISLFKDYLFNQLNENDQQIIDFGHVIDCLNKLDIGSNDKILLITKDEDSLLVISFKELKNCIGLAFHDLLTQKN
eukprot:gene569-8079_t